MVKIVKECKTCGCLFTCNNVSDGCKTRRLCACDECDKGVTKCNTRMIKSGNK